MGLPDSGKRRTFETGSVRDDDDGKGRMDLLPPDAMLRKALHLAAGAEKYGDHNYRLGQPRNEYLRSILNHVFKWLGGDDSEDHLAAIGWNADAAMQLEEDVKNGHLGEGLLTGRADLPTLRPGILQALQDRAADAGEEDLPVLPEQSAAGSDGEEESRRDVPGGREAPPLRGLPAINTCPYCLGRLGGCSVCCVWNPERVPKPYAAREPLSQGGRAQLDAPFHRTQKPKWPSGGSF